MEEVRILRSEERLEPDDGQPDSWLCVYCGHDYRTADRTTVKGVDCPACTERGKVGRFSVVEESEQEPALAVLTATAAEPLELARTLVYALLIGRSLVDESLRWSDLTGSRSRVAACWRVISTLRQIIRIGEVVAADLRSSTLRQRMDRLRAAHPDLVNVRDALEHWDEYLRGDGWRQQAGDEGWVLEGLDIADDEVTVVLGPYRLCLKTVVGDCYAVLEHATAILGTVLDVQGGREGETLDQIEGFFAPQP